MADEQPTPEQVKTPAPVLMAAERTWLAWWRTALAASAGALAVGRFAPQALGVPRGPYVALGLLYGLLAIGTLLVGADRQRRLQRAAWTGADVSLPLPVVAGFTVGGVVLAGMTIALVVADA